MDSDIFYDYVKNAENMEPLKAMELLTKTCMDYQGISKGYSSMAYYAGWEWLKVFNNTDHPMAKQTRDMSFAEAMPLICHDYSQEDYDNIDVIHIDTKQEDQILHRMMEELGKDAVYALCMGYWLGNK